MRRIIVIGVRPNLETLDAHLVAHKIGGFRPTSRFFSATYSAALATRRGLKCRPRSGRAWQLHPLKVDQPGLSPHAGHSRTTTRPVVQPPAQDPQSTKIRAWSDLSGTFGRSSRLRRLRGQAAPEYSLNDFPFARESVTCCDVMAARAGVQASRSADSRMATSCSTEPPLTPTPATS
jgi:hypothetical protein